MGTMPPIDLRVYCRRRAADPPLPPFCSERCRLLDLAAWVDGSYRVPGAPLPRDEDREPPVDRDA